MHPDGVDLTTVEDARTAFVASRRYQALGWPVAPIYGPALDRSTGCSCRAPECSAPAKHPTTRHGIHDASTKDRLARIWWSRWPGRGIALATGAPSGVWVLDLDGVEGVDSLRCLTDQHGELPRTVMSRTGGGGYHLLWAMPEDSDVTNSTSQVAPSIDVRGSGGYAILPPSRHVSGHRYEWAAGRSPDDLPPVSAPAWLVELVAPSRPEQRPAPVPDGPRPRRYVMAAIEAECEAVATAPGPVYDRSGRKIAGGARNDTLNRAAFSLARFVERGEADGSAVARALAIAATRVGLAEREIERTLESAFSARGAV